MMLAHWLAPEESNSGINLAHIVAVRSLLMHLHTQCANFCPLHVQSAVSSLMMDLVDAVEAARAIARDARSLPT